MKQNIRLGSIVVGRGLPPVVVAELSGNHCGSLENAKRLIAEAKRQGAALVKLQTYRPDTITSDVDSYVFRIQDPASLWKGRALYELYQEAHTPWEWHPALFAYAHEVGIELFSTPFDETAVDFLEQFNPPCYKIGSPEIIDLPLIRKVAATKKPLILSTGASSLAEIGEAVEAARASGCQELILLRCVAAYPASPSDMHLQTLPHLQAAFDLPVGLSDHSLGATASIVSVAFGACVIEKHFTLSRRDGGVDSAFSLEPNELGELVSSLQVAFASIGQIHYGPLPSEKTTHSHRPGLYFVRDKAAGSLICPEDVRSLRPTGEALPPKEFEHILGLCLTKSVQKGDPVRWELFQGKMA